MKKTGVNSIDLSKYNFDPDNIDVRKLNKEDRSVLEQEFQNLNLSNSFIFSKTMEEPKIAKMLLEEILNISIKKIVYNEEEKTVKEQYFDKGVRFDVYINDDRGTIYNVEMQAADTDDLPRRSRYYQGNIDTNFLKAGKLYKDLKDSYVIFICCFDLFKQDSFIYTFSNKCKEYPEIGLNDGAVKIFLNTKGRNGNISPSLYEFLSYTENSTDKFADNSNSGLVREIHHKVKQIKETNKLGVNYMTMTIRDRINADIARNEGIIIGRDEGINEGILQVASEMVKTNTPIDYIMKVTKLSLEEVTKLRQQIIAD